MTAVGWNEDGWDEPQQPPAPDTPAYRCEGPCCWTSPHRPPGLLTRLLTALRLTSKEQRR